MSSNKKRNGPLRNPKTKSQRNREANKTLRENTYNDNDGEYRERSSPLNGLEADRDSQSLSISLPNLSDPEIYPNRHGIYSDEEESGHNEEMAKALGLFFDPLD